jgi:hypothetical protein
MEDALLIENLDGLSPSTNTKCDPHSNENITSKTNDNHEGEVPAWAHNRWANLKRSFRKVSK